MSSADGPSPAPSSVADAPARGPRDLGWAAAGLALVAAAGLAGLRVTNESNPGPGMTPVAFTGFFAIWAGPGIVGLIGAAKRRREVLVGAGLACLPLAVLSFSGVTLIFLAPAILFLYAGLRDPAGRRSASPHHDRPLISLAVLALLVGAIGGLFATETVCWQTSADGTVRRVPAAEQAVNGGELSIGPGIGAAGCSTGEMSPLGSAIAVACVAGAAGLALRVRRSAD
jgi:hypothetical protein